MKIFWIIAAACVAPTLAGCDDAPTTAVVENGFAAPKGGGAAGAVTVYKTWWVTTLFPDAVASGETSAPERTIPAADYAYALLAPGWSPSDGGAPAHLVAVKSTAKLSVAVHGVLRIVVSDDTFTGDCAAGAPLGADDARLIVERIFPGDFAGSVYDPSTCVSTPARSDGSVRMMPPRSATVARLRRRSRAR
jgi:hypothetical protein